MPLQTRGPSETDHRLSATPGFFSRRGEDLPGYWTVLFMRAVVEHPAGYNPSLPLLLFEEIHGRVVVAFRRKRTLGIRDVIAFEAAVPRLTSSRAYASPASFPRPSPGSLPARAGSPLAGRDSHPLDDTSKFHGVIAIPPFPFDQQSLVALFALRSTLRQPASPPNGALAQPDPPVRR